MGMDAYIYMGRDVCRDAVMGLVRVWVRVEVRSRSGSDYLITDSDYG